MRLLVDRNLTPRWISGLAIAGHDCLHWSDVGPVTATDSEICRYARENDFVVLTNDLDFPRILAHTKEGKPSIILLRGEPLTPEARGAELLRALEICDGDLQSGAIVTIDWTGKVRVRVLPIRA